MYSIEYANWRMKMQNDNITVAKHSGFCFGVKRATDSLEEKIASCGKDYKGKIYTLGKLIHNETYNKSLSDRGVEVISYEDILGVADGASEMCPVTVFVRAHGITCKTEELLVECSKRNPYFSFVDCTCPFVKRIHKIAADNSGDDRAFILMGKADHPEVVGIMSWFNGEKYVFSSEEEFERAYENGALGNLHKKTPIIVAQTTFNLSQWKKSNKKIKLLYTKAIIFDTICSVTESRQLEAENISKHSDLMIVIGGRESSNTAKLAEICEENCHNTLWIESAYELKNNIPFTHRKVGIVAGASTPDNIIEEVYQVMSAETQNTELSFEELLNKETPKTLNTGDTVTGIVTSVSPSEIQLDLGTKVTGRISADQITDDPSVKLADLFKIGDAVEAFVIKVSDIDGFATLSKKRADSDKNWLDVVAAYDNGEALSGKVIEAVKGGVIILANAVKVFIPASQSGVPKDGDLASIVGNDVQFKIIEIKPGKKSIGSIRAIERENRRAKEAEFWASIEEGKQYTGIVKSMTSYGAFVDLGGVDGMVHASELSWKHIKNPAEVLALGDVVTVYVKSFDKEAKRISLGYKTEATNPWIIFTANYAVGDVVPVKIVNMMPFGAFAEIIEGVDGLIHISQISQTRIGKPQDVLEIGQSVDAKIIEIDNEKQKISLSIRVLLDEATAATEVADAAEAAKAAKAADAADAADVAEATEVSDKVASVEKSAEADVVTE